MRYLLTLIVDTRDDPASLADVEDIAYMGCNEIAELRPSWFVDITELEPEVNP